MVLPSLIRNSNKRLPPRLTAVFVGATSGIGLYTLLALARHCVTPTIYFVGRSQDAGTAILAQLKTLNAAGSYTFIRSDVSEIKNVDTVCAQILEKETQINMLVLSQGTMIMDAQTQEGIAVAASLILHSRIRFALNLLPLLRAAPGLRRVVSIFAGSKEGPVNTQDLYMKNIKNPLAARGQAVSMQTLLWEEVQRRAPDVGFVHDYPGFVKSSIARGGGLMLFWMRNVGRLFMPFFAVPEEECGERHLFLASSARFRGSSGEADGMAVGEGVEIAKGTDGRVGSGVYTVDELGESAGEQVVQLLKQLRAEKTDELVWEDVRAFFLKVTGRERL